MALVVLVISLFVLDMPVRNGATGNTDSPSVQDPSLLLSATNVSQPGGGTVLNLTGKYQRGGKTVNLRSSTVKSGFHIRPTGPPSQSPSAPAQGYQPETDYYSSSSDMTKSDGTLLAEAV
jgi:hypothetical protein